LKWWRGRGWN